MASNENLYSIKPKLIVFDLDYTLWPFWVDTHVDPPFRKDGKGKIVDARGRRVKYYQEVPSVLEELHKDGYTLGVASRTSEIKGANQLLQLLDWDKFFTYKEIYPGCKINHFQRLQADSKYEFKEMLFFDDEVRNKIDLDRLDVLTVVVEDGVSKKLVQKGLLEYSTKRQKG